MHQLCNFANAVGYFLCNGKTQFVFYFIAINAVVTRIFCLDNIIAEFEKLSGVPIVLNTSFNINGEPVVLTPDDALNTLFNSGLEHLFLSDYYIAK